MITTRTQSIYDVLHSLSIPCAYSHFTIPQEPPYVVYLGNGQTTLEADNTHYYRENQYQVEYYFTEKNESLEAEIEDALLSNGYIYDKSEDIYIESEGVFLIYYYV